MRTMTVIGGNLMQIALTQLGDATAFVTLMQVNNLTDYILPAGIQTVLQIPDPVSPSLDGVVAQ